MKELVALGGTVNGGICSWAAWQLCQNNNIFWWIFLLTGFLFFFISAAISMSPTPDE